MHYIDIEIVYQRNNNADHIAEEVHDCPDGEVKI
jgi:hypothetical protein